MSLEINTAGMRRSWKTPYPAPEILPLAAAHGLGVIAGSDAHEPQLVGYGFAEVDRWIAASGLRLVRYRGRRPRAAQPEPAQEPCASEIST
jgi:histidinol-phosphatase (PHP family)